MATHTRNVVLIGPTGSGKPTLLPLVAERTGPTPIELDDVRWEHYADLGYDHEHADDENADLFDRVRNALAGSTVVLLLPSGDVERSWATLEGRVRTFATEHMPAEHVEVFLGVVRWMLDNPSNARLATHVVHAAGVTPEEIPDEIASLVLSR